ncbi:MAG: carbohydrate deacetylase [Gemmatimonadales bacterium]
MRRLIINADDFGLSPAVTAGILEAHAAGAVTSSSMMVHCAGWDDGVRQARSTPTLGIGLHLNLLVGAPLTRSRSLTDARTGRFPTLLAMVARACRGACEGAEVAAECEAQLAAMRDAGIRVTHIDSHRHTHALPGIRRAVASVAALHGLPLRRPVESARWFPADVRAQLHRAVIAWSWRISSRGADSTRAADHFVGVSLQGGVHFATRFASVLGGLPGGSVEVMVHPGRVDDALRAADGYTWQRELELRALLSPAIRERLSRAGTALIGFADL